MLKTIEDRLVSEESDFESIVLAFENANSSEQSPDIDSFLPDDSHPQHSSILRELIRLDMEFSWARGTPHRAADFQRRYPDLFDDPDAVQEIAFEEYRLRLGSGERPTREARYADQSESPSTEGTEAPHRGVRRGRRRRQRD